VSVRLSPSRIFHNPTLLQGRSHARVRVRKPPSVASGALPLPGRCAILSPSFLSSHFYSFWNFRRHTSCVVATADSGVSAAFSYSRCGFHIYEAWLIERRETINLYSGVCCALPCAHSVCLAAAMNSGNKKAPPLMRGAFNLRMLFEFTWRPFRGYQSLPSLLTHLSCQ
jgi:hypothetical protein